MSSCAVLWPLIALAGWVFGNLAVLGVMAAFDFWHTCAGTDCACVDCLRRAERRLAEMMAEQPKQGPGEHWEKKRGNENPVALSLALQGIDRNLAKRAARIRKAQS